MTAPTAIATSGAAQSARLQSGQYGSASSTGSTSPRPAKKAAPKKATGTPVPPRGSASGGGAASTSAPGPASAPRRGWFGPSSRAGRAYGPALAAGNSGLDNGAGVILAYFVYVWVLLPLVQGGPSRVKDVFRAKFFNKDSKGDWLP